MWKSENINIGRVKAKEPVTVKFDYLSEGIFVSAKSSCGCSVPIWKDNYLEVIYTPNNIAKHLEDEGKTEYESVKHITVIMIEGYGQKNYDLKIQSTVYK
tara:strand:- start:11030 stop:11329 length:300 start_codon:yes stop_codon:yes gene_type:complete